MTPQPYLPPSSRTSKPPAHLSASSKAWWRTVVRDFELEAHHLKLLSMAASAWDRAEEARKVLATEGLVFLDRFGCPHSRPEVAIERDSRIGFMRALRELALDVSAPDTRPPGIGYRR